MFEILIKIKHTYELLIFSIYGEKTTFSILTFIESYNPYDTKLKYSFYGLFAYKNHGHAKEFCVLFFIRFSFKVKNVLDLF